MKQPGQLNKEVKKNFYSHPRTEILFHEPTWTTE